MCRAPEFGRVVHRRAVRIIVEVGEDIQSASQILLDLPGLDGEGLARVAPTVADTVTSIDVGVTAS